MGRIRRNRPSVTGRPAPPPGATPSGNGPCGRIWPGAATVPSGRARCSWRAAERTAEIADQPAGEQAVSPLRPGSEPAARNHLAQRAGDLHHRGPGPEVSHRSGPSVRRPSPHRDDEKAPPESRNEGVITRKSTLIPTLLPLGEARFVRLLIRNLDKHSNLYSLIL